MRLSALALVLVAAVFSCGAPSDGRPVAHPDESPRVPRDPAAVARPSAGGRSAPEPSIARGGTLTVRFLDVGQGDSALVATDDGHALLVDAGPLDGALHVTAALRSVGDARLDGFVLTHPHADHEGQLDRLMATFHFQRWLDSGSPRPASLARVVARSSELHIETVRRGERFALGAHADVTILAPSDPLFSHTRSDPNANSIVLRIDHHALRGDVRFLFEADAEEPTEKRLLENRAALRADVLKVAHHGSSHASTDALLTAVSPRLAVISCGRDNEYGHPAARTLARLEAHHATIARTDLEGDVTVTSDDQGLAWTTDRPADPAALRTPGVGKLGAEAP